MNNSKLKLSDLLSWIGFLILTIAAFVCVGYGKFSGPIIAVVWIIWLVCSLTIMYFTTHGRQCYLFIKDAKLELEKVVWPSRQETTQTTIIVIIMVMVAGLVLWGIDSGMTWAIGKITQLG